MIPLTDAATRRDRSAAAVRRERAAAVVRRDLSTATVPLDGPIPAETTDDAQG